MSEPVTLPRLRVTTTPLDQPEDLLAHAAPHSPLVWVRRGEGFVGSGRELLRLDVLEDGRLEAISALWQGLVMGADVRDEVGTIGTGLIAFIAGAFDDQSLAPTSLVVPSIVIGKRGDAAWITSIAVDTSDDPQLDTEHPLGPHWSATLGPGMLSPADHMTTVATALDRITAGDAEKVVIARDLVGTLPADADLRRLVRSLADSYPDTWTFAVDGIIGASPETLVTVAGGAATARVLAGTRGRGSNADEDSAISAELASSEKDLDEHRYAVASVLESLAPHVASLASAESPHLLKLPNVWHLATDIEATLCNGATALDLVRAMHPTAAVAGAPTAAAVTIIRELEPFDRGRYSGPVGWIDQRGDGEFAIALRCAQVGEPTNETGDLRPITAHAGGGVVAGSTPEAELLETRVKFRPIVDALA